MFVDLTDPENDDDSIVIPGDMFERLRPKDREYAKALAAFVEATKTYYGTEADTYFIETPEVYVKLTAHTGGVNVQIQPVSKEKTDE